mmetsp:Transcript_74379/g.210081  ORF Transcript_74379/g.210081 Transcript_74379/m.210081 type:complete len:205 (+) Transcript_74379:275-889(+)
METSEGDRARLGRQDPDSQGRVPGVAHDVVPPLPRDPPHRPGQAPVFPRQGVDHVADVGRLRHHVPGPGHHVLPEPLGGPLHGVRLHPADPGSVRADGRARFAQFFGDALRGVHWHARVPELHLSGRVLDPQLGLSVGRPADRDTFEALPVSPLVHHGQEQQPGQVEPEEQLRAERSEPRAEPAVARRARARPHPRGGRDAGEQ